MTKKTYSFGPKDDKDTWKEIKFLEPKKDPYEDLLRDYQKKAMDTLYDKYLGTNLCNEVSLSHSGTTTTYTYPQSSGKTTSMTARQIQDLLDLQYYKSPSSPYGWKSYGNYDTYHVSPKVEKSDAKVEVRLDDGTVESITREELIKYIGERQIVRENEVVRKVYERYQVAVKLVRSDDNGDTGV